PHVDREQLVQDVLHEALGLGPLEPYLADETVSEIMVNGPNQVYVEREGRLERVEKAFSSPQAVLAVIERIVAPLGRHVDESTPPSCSSRRSTGSSSRPGRRTSKARGRSPSATWSAMRCGCGPTASSSASAGAGKRWTCSRP